MKHKKVIGNALVVLSHWLLEHNAAQVHAGNAGFIGFSVLRVERSYFMLLLYRGSIVAGYEINNAGGDASAIAYCINLAAKEAVDLLR